MVEGEEDGEGEVKIKARVRGDQRSGERRGDGGQRTEKDNRSRQDERKTEKAEQRGKERDTGEGIHRKNVTVSHHNVYTERDTERER